MHWSEGNKGGGFAASKKKNVSIQVSELRTETTGRRQLRRSLFVRLRQRSLWEREKSTPRMCKQDSSPHDTHCSVSGGSRGWKVHRRTSPHSTSGQAKARTRGRVKEKGGMARGPAEHPRGNWNNRRKKGHGERTTREGGWGEQIRQLLREYWGVAFIKKKKRRRKKREKKNKET